MTAPHSSRAFGRFFSSSGRSSILRFAIILATGWLIVRQSFVLFQSDSFAIYAAGGALLGTLLAKAVAEVGRRLHDAGWGGWAGWTLCGTLLWYVLDGMSHMGEDLRRPQQWLPLVLVAILLLRPGVRTANRWGDRPGWLLPATGPEQHRAAPMAAASILGFVILMSAILSISHGMRDNQRRIVDRIEREDARATAALVKRVGLALPASDTIEHSDESQGIDDAIWLVVVMPRADWEALRARLPAEDGPPVFSTGSNLMLGPDNGAWRPSEAAGLTSAQLRWAGGAQTLNIGVVQALGKIRLFLFWHEM